MNKRRLVRNIKQSDGSGTCVISSFGVMNILIVFVDDLNGLVIKNNKTLSISIADVFNSLNAIFIEVLRCVGLFIYISSKSITQRFIKMFPVQTVCINCLCKVIF